MLRVIKYVCDICGKEVDEPLEVVRFVKQLYGIGRYQQFSTDTKMDLCLDCADRLESFIEKEVDRNGSKQVSQSRKKETKSVNND